MIWWAWLASLHAKPLDANLLYFVLVDRFSNGNFENDVAVDTSDPQAFHGGDLEGITNQISYIKELGADALWISPIFHMRTEKFGGHGAFHGYWVQNLDAIEPAFGGEDALLSLSKKSEENGLSLIMDMVYNHVSFDSPLRETHKHWFHDDKTIENWNDPYERTHYQVHGLPDLDQSNEEVYAYLREQSLYWKDKASLSGFRIDAVGHMENSFLARLSDDVHQTDPNMWLLGEDFEGNPVALIHRAKESKLDALFDFPTYYALTDLFCKQGSLGAFASTLWLDRYYPKEVQLVTFLDNHDLPRLHSSCTEKNALFALFTQFSIRGLPMITYGTELGSLGKQEPENRADMPWGTKHPAQELIRTLTKLRTEHPVLKDGIGSVEKWEKDVLVYTQHLGSESSTLIINQKETPISSPHSFAICFDITKKNGFAPCSSPEIEPQSIRLGIRNASPQTKRYIRTEIVVSSCAPENNLRIVGSSLEVGGWNPNNGIHLVYRGNNICQTSLLLPEDAVIRFKIVDVQEKKIQWGQGPDQILWNTESLQLTWTP